MSAPDARKCNTVTIIPCDVVCVLPKNAKRLSANQIVFEDSKSLDPRFRRNDKRLLTRRTSGSRRQQ
jgi:hypothetical protein